MDPRTIQDPWSLGSPVNRGPTWSYTTVKTENTESSGETSTEDEDTEDDDSWGSLLHPCQLQRSQLRRFLWERFFPDAEPNVFGYHNLRIAPDGGMKDVPKLLYLSQYFYAVVKVAGSALNCYVLMVENLKVVSALTREDHASLSQRETDPRNKFLLSAWIACRVTGCEDDSSATEDRLHYLIPIMEIVYMLFNILACCVNAAVAPVVLKCCRVSPSTSLLGWSAAANLFFEYLPELVSFSALKILYYVTPTIFVTQGYLVAVHALTVEEEAPLQDKVLEVLKVLWFLVTRVLMLVFGFDAFLVKFRMVSDYINKADMTSRDLIVATLFLFQVLGAVKLHYFVRERLYILIFGGEDGQLDRDETELYKVWEALLARKVYQTFGFFKGTIVMLAYDDYDFQTLVLDDDEIELRQKARESGDKPVFEEGDSVVVKKEGPLNGKVGTVVNPSWHALVKVDIEGLRSNADTCFAPEELEFSDRPIRRNSAQ